MGENVKFYWSLKENLVKEKNQEFAKDLGKRLFDFSVNIIRFLSTVSSKYEYFVFKLQLSKSGTSIGANFEESQSAFSRKEFIFKIGICLKESKESNYWLRICDELKLGENNLRLLLLSESVEFIKIFTSCLKTARSNSIKM